MRLLETRRARPGSYPFRLTSFHTAEAVPYAILSHTWGDDELLHEDVVHRTGETKQGYNKVLRAVQRARDDGHRYIWIDNVCIDKSSNAELQEAINSMFAWYSKATICYAHLSDVREPNSGRISTKHIAASRWFKRGWTLQELIAPRVIKFFTMDWTLIGDKTDLLDLLSTATSISRRVLSDVGRLQDACIAVKMSWAAGRETTRGEDRAYSLMGLFGVNMPLLYGEGAVNAFLRLQEEIMRRSDDHSLFAWREKSMSVDELHGLLADSPDAFDYRGVNMVQRDRYKHSEEPYAMTNRGLQISLSLIPHLLEGDMVYTALLNCSIEDPDKRDPEPLELHIIRLNLRSNTFARFKCETSPFREELTAGAITTECIFVPQYVTETHPKGQTLPPTAAPNALLDHHELKQLQLICDAPEAQQFRGKLSGIFAVRHDWEGEPCLSFFMREQVAKSVVEIRVGTCHGVVGFELVSSEDSHSLRADHDVTRRGLAWTGVHSTRFRRSSDDRRKRNKEERPSNLKFQPFGTSARYHGHDVTVHATVSVRHGVRFFDVTTLVQPVRSSLDSEHARATKQAPGRKSAIDQSSSRDEADGELAIRPSRQRSRPLNNLPLR